jgi:RNA polymerase sigma-70 factor, ECF subfamily
MITDTVSGRSTDMTHPMQLGALPALEVGFADRALPAPDLGKIGPPDVDPPQTGLCSNGLCPNGLSHLGSDSRPVPAAINLKTSTHEPVSDEAGTILRGDRDQDQDQALEVSPSSAAEGGAQENYAAWVELVDRIRAGRTEGMAELYQLFSKGIRFYLCRQLGPQELDDKVHDTFLVVVQAIRKGELREPERLMGFVRTIVRRQVAAHIDKVVHTRRELLDLDATIRIADPRGNPEETAIFRQRAKLIQIVLKELPDRDREILTRFYLREQSQEQICSEMELTETQFRLLKSRAKARFGELGKKKVANRAIQGFFLRTSAGFSH